MYIKCIFNLTTAELPAHHCERTKLGSRGKEKKERNLPRLIELIDGTRTWNEAV